MRPLTERVKIKEGSGQKVAFSIKEAKGMRKNPQRRLRGSRWGRRNTSRVGRPESQVRKGSREEGVIKKDTDWELSIRLCSIGGHQLTLTGAVSWSTCGKT